MNAHEQLGRSVIEKQYIGIKMLAVLLVISSANYLSNVSNDLIAGIYLIVGCSIVALLEHLIGFLFLAYLKRTYGEKTYKAIYTRYDELNYVLDGNYPNIKTIIKSTRE